MRFTVDKQIVKIPTSLSRALYRVFRHTADKTNRDFHVWADGLCINQNDDDEKASQVVKMDLIYVAIPPIPHIFVRALPSLTPIPDVSKLQ